MKITKNQKELMATIYDMSVKYIHVNKFSVTVEDVDHNFGDLRTLNALKKKGFIQFDGGRFYYLTGNGAKYCYENC